MRNPSTHGVLLIVLASIAATMSAPECSAQAAAAVRFTKLYSTLDGHDQAVEVDIDASSGAPLRLGGRKLTFRDARGRERSQVLPSTWDGPVKRAKLLMSYYTGNAYGEHIAEIALDRLILPIDGGTVELEGMDTWTFGPLPLDGRSALARDGTVVPALLDRYLEFPALGPLPVLWDRPHAIAYEYRLAGTDHYLTTARASEIELLNRGGLPGWVPTNKNLVGVHARSIPYADSAALPPVCRYLSIHPGGASHVLSSDERECDQLRNAPGGVFETGAAFHAYPPDKVTGACPLQGSTPTYPVYRMWNGQANAGHRLVTDKATRDSLVASGWIAEGFGPEGVIFCNWWEP